MVAARRALRIARGAHVESQSRVRGGRPEVLAQLRDRQQVARHRRHLGVAERRAHALERLPAAQARRRLLGARARLVLRAQRRGAHEHLLHEQPLGAREVVAVLLEERAHFLVAGITAVGLRHHEVDHGRDDVAAHAAVVAREAELEPALHEQLFVDQPVEHVAALVGADRLAAVRRERRGRAVVLLEPDHRAVHRSRRVGGQRAIALAREQQAHGRARDARSRAQREPDQRARRSGRRLALALLGCHRAPQRSSCAAFE